MLTIALNAPDAVPRTPRISKNEQGGGSSTETTELSSAELAKAMYGGEEKLKQAVDRGDVKVYVNDNGVKLYSMC